MGSTKPDWDLSTPKHAIGSTRIQLELALELQSLWCLVTGVPLEGPARLFLALDSSCWQPKVLTGIHWHWETGHRRCSHTMGR